MKRLLIKHYLIIVLVVMVPISVAADELPDAFTLSWLEYRSNHPELLNLDLPIDTQKANKPIAGKWDLYAQTDDSSAAKTGSGEDEGQPEMEGAATMNAKMLGEMWVVCTSDGEVAGMQYRSMQTIGYDAAKKKFVGTWVDSMNPHL